MQSLFCTALLPRPLNRLSDRPQVAARHWEEPHPPRGKHLFQTGLEPFGTLRQMQKAQCLAQVCSGEELQAASQRWAVGEAPAVLLACWTRYSILSWDSCKPAARSAAIRRLFPKKNADALQSAAFCLVRPALLVSPTPEWQPGLLPHRSVRDTLKPHLSQNFVNRAANADLCDD